MDFDDWIAAVKTKLVKLGVPGLEVDAEIENDMSHFEAEYEGGTLPDLAACEWFSNQG